MSKINRLLCKLTDIQTGQAYLGWTKSNAAQPIPTPS